MSDQQKNEIVLSPVAPLMTPEQAAAAWQLFLELKKRLLSSEDYVRIGDNDITKKSGFRKIAVAFNLSDRIVEQERTERDDGSFMWRVVAEAKAPNDRTCIGVGVCDSRERKFAHVEHDVYSTAHTRAKNRAISDMVAGGIVSFEEMEVTSTSRDSEDLVSPIGNSQEPAGEDTPKRVEISYTVEGADTVFKVPYPSKDRFKEVIHTATGTYPRWDNAAKTWNIDADLVNHVLLEELEKAGLDVEVV